MKDLGRRFEGVTGDVGYLGYYNRRHLAYKHGTGIVMLKRKPVFKKGFSKNTLKYYSDCVSKLPANGQHFIGNDGKKYTHISSKGLSMEVVHGKESYLTSWRFVKKALDSYCDKKVSIVHVVSSKKAYGARSLEEKIRTGLTSFYNHMGGT